MVALQFSERIWFGLLLRRAHKRSIETPVAPCSTTGRPLRCTAGKVSALAPDNLNYTTALHTDLPGLSITWAYLQLSILNASKGLRLESNKVIG